MRVCTFSKCVPFRGLVCPEDVFSILGLPNVGWCVKAHGQTTRLKTHLSAGSCGPCQISRDAEDSPAAMAEVLIFDPIDCSRTVRAVLGRGL